MTFEEWLEQQKNNLNPKASEKLDEIEPELQRAYNSGFNNGLEEARSIVDFGVFENSSNAQRSFNRRINDLYK